MTEWDFCEGIVVFYRSFTVRLDTSLPSMLFDLNEIPRPSGGSPGCSCCELVLRQVIVVPAAPPTPERVVHAAVAVGLFSGGGAEP